MDLTLSEEHASLRATVEDFARKGVARVIGEIYERGEFPYEIVAKMGAMGLFGLPIAEDYGGMGGDYFALIFIRPRRPHSTGPVTSTRTSCNLTILV
jgi:short-chain 2-methylacyl-CoA dehydrogenase